MKNVYLHGELGKRFGKKWELNVFTPGEAVNALFANEPEIERYLFKKQQEGICYGIKKSNSRSFATAEECNLLTEKDLHVFPVPQGSGGFITSLLVMAATTAASIYISKKMAEAMERDESVLQVQTKSYLYNGTENKFQQGATIPVGYGKMIVGSNVISSCNINYDYNSETQRIFSFSNGLYSLIPSYSPHYFVDLGPLVSSFARSVFDGESRYRMVDPAFQYIARLADATEFGTIDGLYGGFESVDSQTNRTVKMEKQGNSIGGYYYYFYNFAKGVNQAFLGNFDENTGNWYPSAKITDAENQRYAITERDAISSSFVCLQSVPIKESSQGNEKIFYPIIFSEDSLPYLKENQNVSLTTRFLKALGASAENQPETNGAFPVQVGQRYRGGLKSNGVGWYKLESTSIAKSIDLVSEGEIDGFSDKNGKKLEFDREFKLNDPNQSTESLSSAATPAPTREPDNDYLQGVFLDDIPVKEISFETQDGGLDGYNINEFDIDMSLGSEDQELLEDQYLFTANTKEIGTVLYGPRTVNFAEYSYALPSNPFQQGVTYAQGEMVTYEENSVTTTYQVMQNTDEEFSKSGDYQSGSFVYIGEPPDSTFYEATEFIDEYKIFSGEHVTHDGSNFSTYSPDDTVRSRRYNDTMGYYKMGPDANKFLGTYSSAIDYSNQQGSVIMNNALRGGPNTNAGIFIITGTQMVPGDSISSFATGISMVDESDQEYIDYGRDPVYMMSEFSNEFVGGQIEFMPQKLNETDGTFSPDPTNAVTVNIPTEIVSHVDISPSKEPTLWNEKQLTKPSDLEGIFRELQGSDLDNLVARKLQEENYEAHRVINPLVEEAYVSLQIDELMYVYEGDEINVEYKIGKLWTFLLLGLSAYHIYKSVKAIPVVATYTGLAESALMAQKVAIAPPQPAASAALALITSHTLTNAAKETSDGVASGVLVGVLGIILSFVLGNHRFKIGTKVENSGEFWPNKARFRIKYGNEGEELYSTDIYFYGIANSSYRKDVKIYFPPNPDQRDRIIKVYKLNRERNAVKEGEQAARYREKFALASITEITPVKLNYPNSVLIGTRVNAKDVSTIPKRTYYLRMKTVQVPSNYDSESRRYTGNWNGEFKPEPEWTDNPAWCLYDLISNKRFGVGRFGIKEENIDRWTLYKIAKYCDQMVPTGYSPKYKKRTFAEISNLSTPEFLKEFNYTGKKLAIFYDDGTYESITISSIDRNQKTMSLSVEPKNNQFKCAVEIDYPLVEPRYTLNAYIMDKQNAFKLINEFALIFRAYSYWSGGAINFFQDEKKEAVMLFSNNNISEAGFAYSSTPKSSRTNACNIRYTDRYNMYRPKMERAEDREAVHENNMIEQTIDGFGITSQAQAKRATEFLVKSANMETEILSFQTSMIGSYLKPGDVIDVLDNKRTVGRFAGHIVDIQVDSRGMMAEVTIDHPMHTIIEPFNKLTWKNIEIYQPSGNETIASLDSATGVTDEDINNMRFKQFGTYQVFDIDNDGKTLKLYNDLFTFVEGSFTWYEAILDAREKGGRVAQITDESSQLLSEIVLPKDQIAWLGGYNREEPPPEKLVWENSPDCNDGIQYFNWEKDYPKFSAGIETDNQDENFIADDPFSDSFLAGDHPEGLSGHRFITINGSENEDEHGKWKHEKLSQRFGYILEKISNDSLEKIAESAGTTFILNDSVNFAKPKQYKVINITEESNGLFNIQALEYDIDKFDNIEKDISIKNPENPVIFTSDSIYYND
jgi:predicted phage tail protein